ncbi:conserved hypothetical protein [Lebetimonas natsushimae]|uniref:Uncharacterized protein n=1 Tax=Lebetimonas natsushimae TaxID=1936991 RepID=A0A292YCJ7_9BACT|nr:DUF4367 domain-containing protein [Lebetimonas natsushimae]GAX87065.1 conserved hypothetical protein [Lebetimonas natsushimae]
MKKFIFLLFSFILLFAADYKDLCKNLPDKIDVYVATDKCNGMNIEMNDIQSSQAERDYQYNNKTFSLSIVTGTFAMQIFPVFMQNLKIETNGEVTQTTSINKHKAIISYDKEGGNITVLLKNNPENPEILVMNFNNLSKDEALKIIKKLILLK